MNAEEGGRLTSLFYAKHVSRSLEECSGKRWPKLVVSGSGDPLGALRKMAHKQHAALKRRQNRSLNRSMV